MDFLFPGKSPRARSSRAPACYGARKALVAAPAAALAAAVRTAWLEKTPAANSSCAFWKLAPVRRYREWIWRRVAGGGQRTRPLLGPQWTELGTP